MPPAWQKLQPVSADTKEPVPPTRFGAVTTLYRTTNKQLRTIMTDKITSTAADTFTEEDFEEHLFFMAVEAASGIPFSGQTEEEKARDAAVLSYGLEHFPNLTLSPERIASANGAAAGVRRGFELTAALQK